MQNYELMLVVQGQIPEDLAKEVNLKVNKNLQELGAKNIKEDFWGRRKLAYKIGQQDHGYYDIFDFSISGEQVSKIEAELKLIGEIIRYLITKKDMASKEEKVIDKKIKKESVQKDLKDEERAPEIEEIKQEIKKPAVKKEEKTDKKERLKELDQKIDEILKD